MFFGTLSPKITFAFFVVPTFLRILRLSVFRKYGIFPGMYLHLLQRLLAKTNLVRQSC